MGVINTTLILIVLAAWLACPAAASADVLEGIIFDDRSGQPLQSVLVRVSGADATALQEIETGRDGRFLIEGLSAGDYHLTISKANFMRLEVRATAKSVRTPESAAPVFRLIGFGVLSGRILPPRSGSLTLLERVADGRSPRIFSATATNSGDYRFFNIPPGRYVLRLPGSAATTPLRGLLLHPGSNRPREFMFHGGDEYANVDVVIPEGPAFTLTGKIESPQANGSYMVAMISPDYPALRLTNSSVSATGTFKFEGIAPGTYDLLVSNLAVGGVQPLFGRASVSVLSQDIENVVVRLESARPANISMQAQAPCSPEGAITLTLLEAWLGVQPRTLPLTTGQSVPVDGLAPTRYRVAAKSNRGDCSGTAVLDLRTSTQTLTVSPGPRGSIHGSVRTEGGPTPVMVVLRDVEDGRESPVRAVLTTTGASFVFGHLESGRYCIAAYSNPAVRWVPESGCLNPAISISPGALESVELRP